MSAIRDLFPRPNISVSEKAMNLVIYGFNCELYDKDDYIEARVFVDPDACSMLNICKRKSGELLKRFSFFEVISVGFP